MRCLEKWKKMGFYQRNVVCSEAVVRTKWISLQLRGACENILFSGQAPSREVLAPGKITQIFQSQGLDTMRWANTCSYVLGGTIEISGDLLTTEITESKLASYLYPVSRWENEKLRALKTKLNFRRRVESIIWGPCSLVADFSQFRSYTFFLTLYTNQCIGLEASVLNFFVCNSYWQNVWCIREASISYKQLQSP